jgi:transcriptional regulator with XRE-family HTH domain
MNNLREARLKKGIKAVDLAKALNVSKQTISNWEHGKRNPDIDTLIKLADLYEVSLDYLVGRKDSNDINNDTDLLTVLSNIPADKRKLLMKLLLSE